MVSGSNPFFSVLTITLNNREGFGETRASIEEQSLRDFEWIVIDGSSTDGTLDDLKKITGPNFSYFSEKDNGLFDAMNRGLAHSRGQYVVFMNSGDCFAGPRILESIRERVLASNPRPEMVFGDAWEKDVDGQLLLKKARSIEWLHYGMHTHHQAILYSREALDGILFDESLAVSADYDFTCRVYRRGGASLAMGFPICIFSRGGNSQKRAAMGRSDNWRIQRDVLGHWYGRRLATRAAYVVSHLARTKLSRVYDRLRFQYGHNSN